jgi:hypothetical protein
MFARNFGMDCMKAFSGSVAPCGEQIGGFATLNRTLITGRSSRDF